MSKTQRVCKVCGALFAPCVFCQKQPYVFTYKAVTCSNACADKYQEQVALDQQKTDFKEYQKDDIEKYLAENSDTVESKSEEEKITKKWFGKNK